MPAGAPEPVAEGRAGTDAPGLVGAPGSDAEARYALALAEYRAVEAAIDGGSHPYLAGLDGDDRWEERMRACWAVLKPWWDRLDALRRVAEGRELAAAPSVGSPWPDVLPDLGPRRIGPFTPCGRCGAGSWVRYAEAVRCLSCATTEAAASLAAALSRPAETTT